MYEQIHEMTSVADNPHMESGDNIIYKKIY